jgi:hypothetical protein
MAGCRDMFAVLDPRARHDVRALAERAAAGHTGATTLALDEPTICVVGAGGGDCAWTVGARTFVLHGAFAGGVPAWARDALTPLEQLAERCADGIYTLLVWDRREGRLLVSPDLAGLQTLYLAERDGAWLLSGYQRATAVLGTPRIDPAGLASVLAVGFPLGTGSLLDGVRVLPPQCAAVLSSDGLRLLPRAPLTPSRTGATGDDLADACAEAVEESVRIWLGPSAPPLIALSGGIDSRLALGAGLATRTDLVSATWSLPGAGDPPLARRLARAAGVPHTDVPVPSGPRTAAELGAAAWESETVSGEHLPFYREPWLAYLAQAGRPVVHGLTGDSTSGRAHHRLGVPLDQLDGPAGAATAALRDWGGRRSSSALIAAARPAFRDLLAGVGDAWAAEWTATPGDTAAERMTMLLIASLDRRRTCLLVVRSIGLVAPVLAPFYTRDYIRFALGLPADELLHRRLVRRMIARRYPRLARVPEAGVGRPVQPRTGAYGFYDKARRRVQGRPLEATRAFRPLIRAHLPVFAQELRAGVLDDYVDVGAIATAWEVGDLGGLTESETLRLFNVSAVLRRLAAVPEPLLR